MKAWIMKSEKEINEDTYYKRFEVCDKHIEVEYTHGFMRYVWLIGIFVFSVAARSTEDLTGLIFGLLGLGVIWLISLLVTQKVEKDLHLLFYIERDAKHDVFLAIDLKTNEILEVHHYFPDQNDEQPATVYAFKKINLEMLKNYVNNSSEHYYDLVKDITPATINTLKNIQFGETDWKWVWFTKQQVEDKTMLGCIRISTFDKVYVKYVELSEADYKECFGYGKQRKLREIYSSFVNENNTRLKDCNVKSFSKTLERDEVQTFANIFNGDERKCNTQIERYFSDDFINEFEHEGNAYVCDVNGIKFLQYLANKKEGELFTPMIFSDDQIINEPIIENNQETVTGNNSTDSFVNQSNDKYKNYGLASLICALATFVPIIPFTWVAGLILGILSIKNSRELGTKQDGKAVAGVIISSLQCAISIFCVIGMLAG